ncbi:hypothetical protein [Halovenus aranensis]|uniref:hypothetical protein n=1 Tax=Halovenus aranensis TaxID=890420 RepID=UPI0011799873|nr:hypothetical protein [Halovenus aranensis]
MKRRTFMKAGGTAIGAAAVAAASTGSGAAQTATATPTPTPGDGGGDGIGEKVADAVFMSPAAQIGSSLYSWAFGDDDSKAEEAAKQTVLEAQHISTHRMFKERRRANQRFLNNEQEVIDLLKSTAFDEATAKAVEKMDQGATLSDVESAALAKVDEMFANPQKDMLDAWGATSRSFQATASNISSKLSTGDVVSWFAIDPAGPKEFEAGFSVTTQKFSTQLVDGSEYSFDSFVLDYSDGTHALPFPTDSDISSVGTQWSLVPAVSNPSKLDNISNRSDSTMKVPSNHDYALPVENDEYEFILHWAYWQQSWKYIKTAHSDVRTQVSTWVSETYDSWQSGDTTVSDLWTPARMRSNLADSEKTPMAVADLIGLGIPTDVNRLYTVQTSWPDEPITWSLRGVVALTSAPSTALESGQTYSTDSSGVGTAFLSHRPAEAVGTLDPSAHSPSLDGGIFEMVKKPVSKLVYSVKTNKGETATFTPADLSEVDGSQKWTIDLSGQLENPIADVAGVKTYFQDGAFDTWTQVSLPSSFTIEKIENSAGEEIQKAEFTDVAPPERNDSWTTAEEYQQWSKQQQQFYQDLVDRMEDLEDDGGDGVFGGLNFGPDFPTLPGLGAIESLVVAGLALFGIGQLRS